MNRNGHILIFSAYYPPHLGGVELYTLHLSDALRKIGYKTTVVTSGFKDEDPNTDESADVIRIPSVSIANDRFPIILPGRKLKAIYDFLLRSNAGHIVINTRYYPLTLMGLALAKQLGIRPLIIDHSSGPISSDASILGALLRLYENISNFLIRRHSPYVCSVSTRGAAWSSSIGFNAQDVIHNSINADEFREAASPRDWRQELGCTSKTLLVTFAGRLIKEKGVLEAIEATEALKQRGLDIKLAIAGGGQLASQISDMQGLSVQYVGPLNRADLSALLRDSNCFCLPTTYPEGLPTILLEAAAQENAIVVSDCAGAREVIPNESFGIVLDDTGSESVMEALLRIYDDPTLSKQLGAAVRNHIDDNFTWDVAAQSLIAVLSKL